MLQSLFSFLNFLIQKLSNWWCSTRTFAAFCLLNSFETLWWLRIPFVFIQNLNIIKVHSGPSSWSIQSTASSQLILVILVNSIQVIAIIFIFLQNSSSIRVVLAFRFDHWASHSIRYLKVLWMLVSSCIWSIAQILVASCQMWLVQTCTRANLGLCWRTSGNVDSDWDSFLGWFLNIYRNIILSLTTGTRCNKFKDILMFFIISLSDCI